MINTKNQVSIEMTLAKVSMLQSIGCQDIATTLTKVHFWTFVEDLAINYDKYKNLTPKQEEALKALVLKHTGVECRLCDKIHHETQYTKESTEHLTTPSKQAVDHPFGELLSIQLFDLPFNEGEEYTYLFHSYNAHSLVVQLANTMYKIPLPDSWEEFTGAKLITFKYHRTAMKGFMHLPDIIAEDHPF